MLMSLTAIFIIILLPNKDNYFNMTGLPKVVVLKNVSKTKEIMVNEKIKLTYLNTLIRTKNNASDIYVDDMKNEFYFNHFTNKLESFIFSKRNHNSNYSNGKKLTLNEIENKAKNFMRNHVDLSIYNRMKLEFTGPVNDIEFIKTIQGYNTTDYVSVVIDEYGYIGSYEGFSCKFDKINVPKIDKSNLLNKLDIFIKSAFKNNKMKYIVKSEFFGINKNGHIYIEYFILYNDDYGIQDSKKYDIDIVTQKITINSEV